MDQKANPGRVLLVDDDALVLSSYQRLLARAGFQVEAVGDALSAALALDTRRFEAVLTDLSMPDVDGIELLRSVHERDPDLPVLIMTGEPRLETAIAAVDHGALRYLVKPIDADELERALSEAVRRYRARRDEQRPLAAAAARAADEQRLTDAMAQLWMAYQPIVRWSTRELFAYEALVRSNHAELRTPDVLLATCERLGRLPELGRRIRRLVADDLAELPPEWGLFVNLHPSDLADDDLTAPDAPLSLRAGRCVLEITERARLDDVENARGRVASLRLLGFRVAVDDLGAGHSGLASISQLEPEIVKLDMSLVRNVNREPIKQRLVGSLVASCQDLGLQLVAEGVETADERDVVAAMGCDLMQGYLFARPGRPFPQPRF